MPISDENKKPIIGEELLDYNNYDQVRQNLYDNVIDSVGKAYPIENDQYVLKLSNIKYDSKDKYSLKEQKKAILEDSTLSRKLQGTWELYDKETGQLLNTSKPRTIINVPYLTGRGTYIRNGTEYTISKQLRLRPGAYTRQAATGNYETQFNVKPRTGYGFKIFMDPASSVFYMKHKTNKVPLYPILQRMGMSDEELTAAWGPHIYKANKDMENKPHAISWLNKFATPPDQIEKIVAEKTASLPPILQKIADIGLDPMKSYDPSEDIKRNLNEYFNKMELDEAVTATTLGTPYRNVTSQSMLSSTKKILGLAQGRGMTDDRDSLEFQNLHDTSDYLTQKIRDDQNGISRQLMYRLTRKKGDLASINTGVLDSHVDHLFNNAGVSNVLEEINPFDPYDQNQRIIKMGEGAIPCHSEDTDVFTKDGWKAWPEISENDQLATIIDDALVFEKPTTVIAQHYEGIMLRGCTKRVDYLVTPSHRMWVASESTRRYTDMAFRTAEDIHGKKVKHIISTGAYKGGKSLDKETICIPPAPVEKSNAGTQKRFPTYIDAMDMITWIAYYLADGYFIYDLKNKTYRTFLTKVKKVNPIEWGKMDDLLQRLPVTYRYVESHDEFVISGKEFAHYFSKFGKSKDKYVPEFIMEGNHQVRELFFKSLTTMDHSGKYADDRIMYASASNKLRDQAAFLAILLGYNVTYITRSETNVKRSTEYQVLCRRVKKAGVIRQHHGKQYQEEDYNGYVYCADMGGKLLFTRRNGKVMWSGNSLDMVPQESRSVQPSYFNFIDAIRSPESMKVGIDMKMARNVRRGPDNMLYTQFINAQTKKPEWVSMRKAARSVIAFPESYNTKDKYVMTMDKARGQKYMNRKDVQYILPNDDDAFSEGSNLVPFKSGVKAMRLLMGAKMASQALPLVNREAPLVQNLQKDGVSVEKFLGKQMGAVDADGRGIVRKVTKDYIEVDYGKGDTVKHEIHDNTPYARKTFIRNNPQVKAGDSVAKGQTLASSNYTSKDGVTALGSNFRIAFMTHHGKNFEDAFTMSESAAKKFTSEHMYQEQLDDDPTLTVDKNKFLALYPGKYSPEQIKTIDDKGMAKKGTVLKYGDPLFLVTRVREPSRETLGRKMLSDESVIWRHKFPGIVVESSMSEKKGPAMFIRANIPLQDGDKISGRYGNKGVIAEVIPDSQMPQDANGNPFDVIMAPEGVISRTNPSQALELQLAKIAEKTGKPFIIPGFTDDPEESMRDYVEQQLKDNGLEATEEIYDPVLRKKIPGIYTGGMYLYKLHHTAEGKLKARSTAGYTQDEQPAKGGKTGAKHIGDMEWQALLGHGAKEIIKDLKITKGQKNDDYWRQVKLGQTPATPSTPFVYDKFKALIQASGIELRDTGTSDNIFAMTTSKVHKLTGDREITSADTFSAGGFKPIAGGLFDPVATGSEAGGNRWSYIKLPEPMLNPIMADPVRHILGLKKKDLEAILSGQMDTPGGKTGSEAIKDMLGRLDLKAAKADAMATIKGGARSKRDAAVKRYNYITAMQKQNVKPEDFLWDRVPVLPPKYRPITRDTKMTTIADPNYLYKVLIESKDDYNELKENGITGKPLAKQRQLIYQNLNALIGLSDPVQPDLQNKRVEGILSQIVGKGSPKTSFVQRRVIGTNIDVSGLGVITPNPNLKLNQVGLPESKAWDLYQDFVIRKMVRAGYPAKQAATLVAKRDKAAYQHLRDVVKERPLIYNRAPTLHKYSILAAWPVLVKGDAVQISPSIVKPLGADFDGDTMSFTVPVSRKAVDEAINKMMPDKVLLSERGDKPNFVPGNEYVKGLYLSTRNARKRPVQKFKTRADAMRAYQKGLIKVDDPIDIEQ